MSQENVEIVAGLFDAMARRDDDALFACYSPDIEWHDNGVWLSKGVHRGHDGVRGSWRASFLGEFEQATFEPHDFVHAGDDVAVTVRVVGRGRSSGIKTDREVSIVCSFRGQQISRVVLFDDRADALKAVGLEE